MKSPAGVSDRLITETPLAVIDIETTGLYPGGDRVVECAIVRLDPGSSPQLVFDSLINPRRHVSATEIHGITDADVTDAPVFEDIAGNVVGALAGCVLAAYNVYFDVKFMQHELSQVQVTELPPHLCLMYLRPMLGLGNRCSLDDACRTHEIKRSVTHQAAADALSGVCLWQIYSETFYRRGIKKFGDIANLRAYKFVDSFVAEPFRISMTTALHSSTQLKSRSRVAHVSNAASMSRREVLSEYWDALTGALADLVFSVEEIQYLDEKRRVLGLKDDELRWLHGKAFSGIIAEMSQDHAIDGEEAEALHRVAAALRKLGWAPGDSASMGAAR